MNSRLTPTGRDERNTNEERINCRKYDENLSLEAAFVMITALRELTSSARELDNVSETDMRKVQYPLSGHSGRLT